MTLNQTGRISNIFDNAGQVFLAVVVLSPLVQGERGANLLVIMYGIIMVVICWGTSVYLTKKGN